MSERIPSNDPNVNWSRTTDRTKLEIERNSGEEPYGDIKLGEMDSSSKYGIYKNRHVIGRDEVINGGIYLGSGEREEIVVDDQNVEAKETYDKVYDTLLAQVKDYQAKMLAKGVEENFKSIVLGMAYDLVREIINYDENFAAKEAELYKNKKINLSYYIESGKGVCRHQALLLGYLLERLKQNGLISGEVSIDRNSVEGVGAHAWVRYKSGTSGIVYILDPAQDFAGRLEDAPGNWPYERPGSTN